MNEQMSEYMDFAKQIAGNAGEIMLKYFKMEGISKYKGDRTIVTLADTEINSYLIDQVAKKYPTHAVDGEESKYGSSNHVWVCDPVDGTAQYARGVPISVFSLALVIDGVPVVGVVMDPFVNEMYWATKGGGAFVNGERMRVSDIPLEDDRALVSFDMVPNAMDFCNVFDVMVDTGKYGVSIGSCVKSCMLVAGGHYVAHLFPCRENKHVDAAAAKVIVEEAGGVVRDFYGNEQRYDQSITGAIFSNKTNYTTLLEIVKKHVKEKV